MELKGTRKFEALLDSYQIYLDLCQLEPVSEVLLTLPRAWTIIRFVENEVLELSVCKSCHGKFIAYPYQKNIICSFCNTPSRAKAI
jgi:flagellar transcriptional activator FlhC